MRMQKRYFATGDGTDLISPDTAKSRWFGNCPVWAANAQKDGLLVVSEPVASVGKAEPCTVPGCNRSHIPVPPPWNDTFKPAKVKA